MANAKSLLGKPARLMLVGYPKSGKTGALSALANVGFKIRFIDFEGNYDPLLAFSDERALANIDIKTFQDKMRQGAKWIEPLGIPTAFNDALLAMKDWKTTDEAGNDISLGASKDWGSDTVVVVDSLTANGESSMRRAMVMMNKTQGTLTSAVWGAAVTDQMNFLKLLTAEANRFHVIVLGHLQMIGPEDFVKQGDVDEIKEKKLEAIGDNLIPTRLYPRAVTKNLSQIIHKEFPAMIQAERKVKHGKLIRVIKTAGGEEIDLGVPVKDIPAEIPLETGLATIFEAMGIKAPGFEK